MDLSIIIINYNTKKFTKNCINSIIDTTKQIDYEIIVINNSEDADAKYQKHKDIKNISVFDIEENKGFGNACNIGVSHALGKYILFLNSDTIVHEKAIDKSFLFINSHKDIAVLGIRTLLEDGTFDHGCKRGFPTPSAAFYYFSGLDKRNPKSKKYGVYRQTFIDEFETSYVDAVSGAFMMMPKELFLNIKGFDEDFFMYGEDLDLCYRIKKQGKNIIYFADAYITHLKGQSGLHKNSKKVIYYFYKAMKIFYKKHYFKKYNIFISALVYLGINIKYVLTLIKSKLS